MSDQPYSHATDGLKWNTGLIEFIDKNGDNKFKYLADASKMSSKNW